MSETKAITPSQTVGPFFKYGLTPHGKYDWNDAFTSNLSTPDASGERIRIETQTERFQSFNELRTNARGLECSADPVIFVVTRAFKNEYVLGGDHRLPVGNLENVGVGAHRAFEGTQVMSGLRCGLDTRQRGLRAAFGAARPEDLHLFHQTGF